MTQLTIEIPDYLARCLKSMAEAQRKSLEQVAQEQLSKLFGRTVSPGAFLRAMRETPHLSPAMIDDLEAAITGGELPVREQGAFER